MENIFLGCIRRVSRWECFSGDICCFDIYRPCNSCYTWRIRLRSSEQRNQ